MLLLEKPIGHIVAMVVINMSRALCVYMMSHALYLSLWFSGAFDVIVQNLKLEYVEQR